MLECDRFYPYKNAWDTKTEDLMPNLPEGRTNASVIAIQNHVYVVGGIGLTSDIFSLDMENKNAEWRRLPGELPILGMCGILHYQVGTVQRQDRDIIIVFGGANVKNEMTDKIFTVELAHDQYLTRE